MLILSDHGTSHFPISNDFRGLLLVAGELMPQKNSSVSFPGRRHTANGMQNLRQLRAARKMISSPESFPTMLLSVDAIFEPVTFEPSGEWFTYEFKRKGLGDSHRHNIPFLQ